MESFINIYKIFGFDSHFFYQKIILFESHVSHGNELHTELDRFKWL
jgi:hypothetical protein